MGKGAMMSSVVILCICSCWRSCFLLSLYMSKVPSKLCFFRFRSPTDFLELAFNRCKVLPFFSECDKDILVLANAPVTYG